MGQGADSHDAVEEAEECSRKRKRWASAELAGDAARLQVDTSIEGVESEVRLLAVQEVSRSAR